MFLHLVQSVVLERQEPAVLQSFHFSICTRVEDFSHKIWEEKQREKKSRANC